MELSKEEIDELIRQAVSAGTAQGVEQGVETVLLKYGFDVKDPLAMQADFAHMRKTRVGCENVRENIIKIFLTVSIPGGIFLLWDTFKQTIKALFIR